jgi:hypothetical protein
MAMKKSQKIPLQYFFKGLEEECRSNVKAICQSFATSQVRILHMTRKKLVINAETDDWLIGARINKWLIGAEI